MSEVFVLLMQLSLVEFIYLLSRSNLYLSIIAGMFNIKRLHLYRDLIFNITYFINITTY